ncbi:MAG: Tfx family DNA-binding protein [Methanomicrobiales archaeon]|nr:Tfx family DNA-binding protein [Methanomicrobiales archaeon]
MKESLLTDRQKDILRYRKRGMTQQQIADVIATSKANVCTIEKSAQKNIARAKETLKFLHTLDGIPLCTVRSGTDLIEAAKAIFLQAEKVNIKVKYDTISLINRLMEQNPEKFRARFVRDDVEVYVSQDGDIFAE